MTPSKRYWRDSTSWTINSCGPTAFQTGGFVIIEVLLSDAFGSLVDNKYCETNFIKPNSNSNDMLIKKQKV